MALLTAVAAGQTVTRVSVGSTGGEGTGASSLSSFSSDGSQVAFESAAANLVAGDTNGVDDIFVHDLVSGTTVRVSVSSAGVEGDGSSGGPLLSPTGRFVLFRSNATNLVSADTNRSQDLFIHDRDPDGNGRFDEANGVTVRVSVGPAGIEANGTSDVADWSADGRFVAFDSFANNLVAGDTNGRADVFVHDRDPDGNGVLDEGNGLLVRVSVSTAGGQGNNSSFHPALSTDGRHVAFHSLASNLVSGDTNGWVDVFVHDRDPDGNGRFDEGNGVTTRLNVNTRGGEADDVSAHPQISADGRHVVFDSFATNLVRLDGNGHADVFVHDRDPDGDGLFDQGNGVVHRLSVTFARGEGDGDSFGPDISADGRRVVFWSLATNLVPGDANGSYDVFLKERDPDGDGRLDEEQDPLFRMSVDLLGREGQGTSWAASIAPDGRRLGFSSDAPDLVPGDTNALQDVFVREATALSLHGRATTGGRIHFELADAPASSGGELWVLLSCTGSDGFRFAPGRTVALTLDACTLTGLRALPSLSAPIDATGAARTPDLDFGAVPPGLVVWAAGLLVRGGSLEQATVVEPITFATE